MRQQSLADGGFEKYRKKTRKELFLEEMDQIIPWQELAAAIEPFYPKPEGAGRRPKGAERMLRIHFLQHWFELSDPAAEEALYDSRAMRQFAGIDLGQEPVPDETTICKFRHLMERHNLGDELFRLVNVYLDENGMKLSRGTIVDASIISAPSSTRIAPGPGGPSHPVRVLTADGPRGVPRRKPGGSRRADGRHGAGHGPRRPPRQSVPGRPLRGRGGNNEPRPRLRPSGSPSCTSPTREVRTFSAAWTSPCVPESRSDWWDRHSSSDPAAAPRRSARCCPVQTGRHHIHNTGKDYLQVHKVFQQDIHRN